MSDNKKSIDLKVRGHRKRKFGDEETKVISFRIAKTIYEDNKDKIRDKITNIIETEVNKKKAKKFKSL